MSGFDLSRALPCFASFGYEIKLSSEIELLSSANSRIQSFVQAFIPFHDQVQQATDEKHESSGLLNSPEFRAKPELSFCKNAFVNARNSLRFLSRP